jgi:hypothetical protein
MNMTSEDGSVGTTTGVDTHQMKNSEWGAVVYLTHSIYGKNSEVWINPYGDTSLWRLKTGYAGGSVNSLALTEGSAGLVQYNKGSGPNASTTGNVYGIYDMSGGAWDYTAGYVDNGNNALGVFGTTYFEDNRLKAQYEKYYDIYEPGDQEKLGGQYYGTGIDSLWSETNSANATRKSLTDATYAKMASKKGDALFEVTNELNFYGKDSANKYTWLKNSTDASSSYVSSWNGDYKLYGHGKLPWIIRGGGYSSQDYAGVFAISGGGGVSSNLDRGFRPVLVSGNTL